MCLYMCCYVCVCFCVYQGIETSATDWNSVMEPAKERAMSFLSDPVHKEQFVKYLQMKSITESVSCECVCMYVCVFVCMRGWEYL